MEKEERKDYAGIMRRWDSAALCINACAVYGITAMVGMEAGRGGGIGDRRGKNGSSVSHGDEIRP